MSRFVAIVLGKTPPAACRRYSPVADALAELIFLSFFASFLPLYRSFQLRILYHSLSLPGVRLGARCVD